MDIRVDDLLGGEVVALLQEHLDDMHATSPPESVHALNVQALKAPEITFFSAWIGGSLAGCVALKHLNGGSAELKSMRTRAQFRNQGVGAHLLTHAVQFAKEQGYQSVSLETGTQEYFGSAHRLYTKFGFVDCPPFADYTDDPHSRFMRIAL
ncbi:GNAT family N-acetyltransferase [Pseudoalteromonas sp. SSDWG2]|uniref:GNAT family N-acetyltransferase n=1 Tax=Pseudoalteromonas sp. SSDWG2 TaxID=3139391 RepID=UPI003BA9AD41